jgi:E3 ubiquitin-protein ligase HUWE1
MSRGNKNKETTEIRADESESTSHSSEEDVSDMSEDGAREETPDLYRNSALGMYGGVSTRSSTTQQKYESHIDL